MSVSYLEDYLDTLESLPLELARNFTQIHEQDATSYKVMQTIRAETEDFMDKVRSLSKDERIERLTRLAALFKECLAHGQEKVSLAVRTYDMVDRHIRRLDEDLAKFEEEQMTGPKMLPASSARDDSKAYRTDKSRDQSAARANQRRVQTTADTPSKRKRTDEDRFARESPAPSIPTASTPPPKSVQVSNKTSNIANKKSSVKNKKTSEIKIGKEKFAVDMAIDPNEPTYCICKQVSFGEMIGTFHISRLASISADARAYQRGISACVPASDYVFSGEIVMLSKICDNDDCPIEWFHYLCVGLTDPVKGKWFCPICVEKRKK
ncbi:hypothetical protein HK105_204341 [Polyrhizophydium stewartii]|uniref:Inhibitor of growth protein N-terminal histone-binding domain-containing protein n=1 Tax=Polyrhizophydium stewartii TaxID=2732419 RepID=A0ABR4N9P0_9FUNG